MKEKIKWGDILIYEEWIENQNDLFYELDQLHSNGLFHELGVDTLSLMYSINYGSRNLTNSVAAKTTKEIAKVISNMYMMKWNSLKNIELSENEQVVGFESKVIFEETNSDATIKNLVTNSVNKVSAFNDDEMSDNTSSDDSIDETGNKQGNRQYTQTKVNSNSIDFQRKMLENNLVISEVICKDISKFISLKIY